jgi:aryl-alcohol dehydrogenase-like predicted oxidoreductase
MQYRNMGKSGLKLSTIALGSLWFGNKVDERMLMPKPTMFYARGYGIDFG